MANVLVQESSLQAIASAIRSKNGTQTTYTPAQMGPAVQSLNLATVPVLGTKTITYNGTFAAEDDNLDGYSSVTVSRGPGEHTVAFDLTAGYVNGSTFTVGGSGYCSDVFRVISGHRYRICLGSTVGNRFRALFTSADPTQASSNISGTGIIDTNSPSANAETTWTASGDGYVTVTKTNAGTSGIKTFVFDITIS